MQALEQPNATRELPLWAETPRPGSGSGRLGNLLSRILHTGGGSKMRELGSYRLVERLSTGGMGEVWRAEHRLLGRTAAVKLIRPEICSRDDAQTGTLERRFEREARVTAALRSPHTVTVYDFGTAPDGSFYYAMELLDGFDLEKLVTRFGPQSPERVIHLLLQVCDSLAEAHAHGLIHRDIKPQNIFVSRLGMNYDFVKVLDFGLVKTPEPFGGSQIRLTLDGTATGTPAFMAPEMAMGNTVDARSDIYSLGCVAYRLLTGESVFEGDSPVSVLLAHIQEPPIPPSQRTEMDIPQELERVILACLEKDPGKRPQSAQELAGVLSACPLPEPWNARRAENWWSVHMPDLAAPRNESPTTA